MKVDCVIVAAGASTRFGKKDKLLASLDRRSVLGTTVRAIAEARLVQRVVVVVNESQREPMALAASTGAYGLFGDRLWLYSDDSKDLVIGGPRRRDSVEAGLRACSSEYVAIHDAARPLVTPDLVDAVIRAAEGEHGAIAAIPVTDTIKEVRERRDKVVDPDRTRPGSRVTLVASGHPDRALLWAAQTPQVVLRQAWLDAAATSDNDETDDAAMLARLGLECAIVEGDPDNIKITRPLDLEIARAILRSRSNQ